MAKDKITDYSVTNASNTDVGGTGIQGTNAISNFDNAVREIMTHLAETNAGTAPLADTFCVADPADLTKKVRLDAGNVTAGQTRVLAMPDQNVSITGDAADFLALTLSSTNKNKNVRVNNAGTAYEFRRNPFYDPYEYGATGDGSTDDTAYFVLCQMSASANEGIQPSPAGRGVIVLPPGRFIVSEITTLNVAEKWLGLGGTLASNSTTLDLFTVDHNYVQVSGLNLEMPLLPTATPACLHHSGGSDCLIENLVTNYGFYGLRGSDGADSSWINCIVNFPYSHNVFFQGYQGAWIYRGKFDGIWPVNQPSAAQITGAMVNGASYSVGDFVTSSGYWFVCNGAGTAPAAGALTPTLRGVTLTTSGTATWRMGTAAGAANVYIGSRCFIFKILNTDISGGHDYGLHMVDDLATDSPQDIYVSGCETGGDLYIGVNAVDVDALRIHNGISHDHCSATDIGIYLGDGVRGALVSGYSIRGSYRGIDIAASSRQVLVAQNIIFGATQAIWCTANAQKFTIAQNVLSGNSGIWGTNATGITIGAGCDYYRIRDNDVTDCTTAGITDNSTSVNRVIDGNF